MKIALLALLLIAIVSIAINLIVLMNNDDDTESLHKEHIKIIEHMHEEHMSIGRKVNENGEKLDKILNYIESNMNRD